jgi:glycerol kinase
MNAGPVCPPPVDGLITTLAWDLDADAPHFGGSRAGPESGPGAGSAVAYALEGSVFSSGAAVQWLRDGIGIIDTSSDLEPLATSVETSQGAVFVPAFTGLGSPHWDPYARGTIVGITRGINRAHLARAVVEAMSFQVRDVLDAMSAATSTPPSVLRVDGGASVMGLLLQLQADQTRIPVARPRSVETTGLGAATLAGLAEGLWGSLDDLAALWTEDVAFTPQVPTEEADLAHQAWMRALDRARRWVADDAI